jgi:transcriptional regulator with XRE-family HTH domain
MRLTNLKLARLARNRRQYEVAATAGLHQSRLSWLENGHVVPRADELRRVAQALGIEDDSELRDSHNAPGAPATAISSRS